MNDTPVTSTDYHDASSDLRSGTKYYYVVKALDSAGNESAPSNEASAVPSYPISAVSLDRPHDARLHDQRGRPNGAGLRADQDRRRHVAGGRDPRDPRPGLLRLRAVADLRADDVLLGRRRPGRVLGNVEARDAGHLLVLGPLLDEPGRVVDELTGAGHADRAREPGPDGARPADRPDREEPRRDLDRPLVDGACRRRSVRLRRLPLDHVRIGLRRGRPHRRGDDQVHRHGPHLRHDLLLRGQGARPGEQPLSGVEPRRAASRRRSRST